MADHALTMRERVASKVDTIGLAWGILFMGLAQFAPWHMANADAVYSFGIGIALIPTVRMFAIVIRAARDGK